MHKKIHSYFIGVNMATHVKLTNISSVVHNIITNISHIPHGEKGGAAVSSRCSSVSIRQVREGVVVSYGS